MGGYIDIAGHATWIEERGSGSETVLLLHGGLSNSDDLLGSIGDVLSERYRVIAFDRRGHGRTADTDAPFHYEPMSDEAVAVLQHLDASPAHLVGWSDGGIVALLIAKRRPELVRKMVLIGANFHHAGVVTAEMDPESPAAAQMVAEYAERSPDGADHFPVVMEKAFTLFATEPTMSADDLQDVKAPTLVLVGDDDMIDLRHTVELYEALPDAQLAVVPGASHGVPFEKPAETARLVHEFLAAEGTPVTFMPVRRSVRRSG
jgi:pimeloyl-ACP methyl ester carboxylesterase